MSSLAERGPVAQEVRATHVKVRVVGMAEIGFPGNPLEFIRRCVKQGKILWTYHVNMRLRTRFIPRGSVVDSHPDYEIIEEYPEDKYLPSYLI